MQKPRPKRLTASASTTHGEARAAATAARGRAERAAPATRNSRSLAAGLAEAGRSFYGRGWVLGTSGNFSAVCSREPPRLIITVSGAHKGLLGPRHFVEIDDTGRVFRGAGRPSAEALLHLAVVGARGAGAVLHTHSVWSTILSETFAQEGGLGIAGYEMLKGLGGVQTHEQREWLPILENSQDMSALARQVEKILAEHTRAHGFLLRGHGLYTWGKDLSEARRRLEILEFLLEVTGRTRATSGGAAAR